MIKKQTKKQQALKAHEDGMEIDAILDMYQVPKTTFYRWVKKAGLPKRGPNKKFTSAEEVAAIRGAYANGESIKAIAKRLQSAPETISALIENKRSMSECVRAYDDAFIDKAVAAYQSGLTSDEVTAKLGVSPASVLRFLKLRGVKARKIEYECDDHFFDKLDTEIKLYWFGFILADGGLKIRRASGDTLEFNLGMKDKAHLELFASHIGYTGPIKEVEVLHSKKKKLYKHANLRIARTKIVSALRRWGTLDFKAGSEWPLTVFDDEQLRHILRGFFDGDGSICLKSVGDYQWYICGPHKKPLEYFMSRCPVVDRHNAIGEPTKYRVQYAGNRIVPKICEWLYGDSSVYLKRKYEVYNGHTR